MGVFLEALARVVIIIFGIGAIAIMYKYYTEEERREK